MSNVIDITVKSKDQTKAGFGSADKSASSFGSKMAKVGKVAAVGALAISAGLLKVGKDSIETSRRMGDLDAKATAVFEDSLAGVQKWAGENKKAFGTSTREVVGLAASFADLLKPMGFTAAQAADMSTKTLDLSGALAEWSGGQYEAAEVSEILSKAMLGERAQLKSLGISITAADVKTRLAKKGQEDLTGAALAQATALATQELIMEKSTDAQKAWADGGRKGAEAEGALSSAMATTSEIVAHLLTPAIEAGTLKLAEFSDWFLAEGMPAILRFSEKVKAKLLPVLKDVGVFVREDVLPALRKIGTKIGEAFAWFVEHPDFAKTLGKIALAIWGISVATNAWAASQALLNKTMLKNPAVIVFAAIGAGFMYAYEKSARFRKGVSKVNDDIAKIGGVAKAAWRWVDNLFAGGAIKRGMENAGKWVSDGWSKITSRFRDAAGLLGIIMSHAWASVRTAVSKGISKAGSLVRSLPGKIRGWLGNLGSLLWNAGAAIIQGLIDGVQSKIPTLVGVLQAITSMIPKVKGPLDKDRILLRPAGIAIMAGLIDGIWSKKYDLEKVLGKVTDFVTKAGEKLSGLVAKRGEIVSSFQGFGQSAFGNEDVSGIEGLLAFQAQQKARAVKLMRNMRRLTKMGVSRSVINQMAAGGESGMSQINALAHGTKGDVARFNSLTAGTNRALTKAGMIAGNDIYGDRIQDARRDFNTAQAIKKALKELLNQQDKNTVVQLHIDGRVLHASLRRLKRSNGTNLGLA